MIARARCSRTTNWFGINLNKNERGIWEAVATFAISQSRVERPGHGQETFTGGLELGSAYPGCIHCGDKSICLCANCQCLNCQGIAVPTGIFRKTLEVKCANCATTGRLLGTIEKFAGLKDL